MMRLVLLVPFVCLAACGPPTPEEAANRCEERARAAQGPEIGMTLGTNSRSGPFASGSLSISADALRGRDPVAVYDSCVQRLTGAPPIRPVRLRAM